MKKYYLLLLMAGLCLSIDNFAQLSKLKEKIKQKVDDRVNRKTDQAIDKTLDNVENSVDGKSGDPQNNSGTQSTATSHANTGSDATGIKAYSKFDFIPGDKIVFADDFSQDVVGEFPLKWNTKGSGEIVTLEGLPGKWLQLQQNTAYDSPLKTKFPENATVEFDLLVDFKQDQRVPSITLDLFSGKSSSGELAPISSGAKITFLPNGGTNEEPDAASLETFDSKGGRYFVTDNYAHYNVFSRLNKKLTPVHVAVWVQKQRMRVWLNEKKLYDLPQAIAPAAVLSQLRLETGSYGGPSENYQYYVSNFKVAVAAPDTRSKLLTEGKWSTTGILFDVNSDKIQSSSYGVLKEIAGVLTENPGVHVKIIGHTDSDGDDGKNLELSKRRAAAVKEALIKQFDIDPSRLQTDGMGESKPVADNKTPEGKAQNRRVEFVKLQ
ncbi:MAG TPA: OmpA family protein [Flavisolibacter sp.]